MAFFRPFLEINIWVQLGWDLSAGLLPPQVCAPQGHCQGLLCLLGGAAMNPGPILKRRNYIYFNSISMCQPKSPALVCSRWSEFSLLPPALSCLPTGLSFGSLSRNVAVNMSFHILLPFYHAKPHATSSSLHLEGHTSCAQ